MTEKPSNELTQIPEKSKIPAYFQKEGGIDELVQLITKEASALHFDYSTVKGRKEARSIAAKVSRSKTLIDSVGKSLTEDWREKTAKVNAQRKKASDQLDALRDKIKQPADDFEAKEAERVKAHMLALDKFNQETLNAHSSSAELKAQIEIIEAVEVSASWEEFETEAREAKALALQKYRDDLKIAQAREEQEEELAQLRAEKEERQRKEREEQAAREREEADRAEKERLERERAEAAEKEREAAEREKAEAEERHRQELEAAKARELEAAKAERERIAEEQRKAEEAEEKRKADEAHRSKITAEIVEAITKSKPRSYEHLIELMIDGKIPHVKVMV